jgi:hypothetical protein
MSVNAVGHPTKLLSKFYATVATRSMKDFENTLGGEFRFRSHSASS